MDSAKTLRRYEGQQRRAVKHSRRSHNQLVAGLARSRSSGAGTLRSWLAV